MKRVRILLGVLACVAGLAAYVILPTGGCGGAGPAGQGDRTPGRPTETRRPNATDQKPAFAGQTRAPFMTKDVAFDVRVVTNALSHPWALAFLPDRSMLVTEIQGRMRIVAPDGKLSEPISGVPKVFTGGQGGLLDVTLAPTFVNDGIIYFAFAEPREGGNGTAVARARLVREGAGAPRLDDVKIVWRVMPTLDSSLHFGCRLVFAKDGTLFVTTGERSVPEGRKQAQWMNSAFGKIIRINADGTAAQDNPFVGREKEGVLPEIFSLGHRNVQAAALHPTTGELWTVEHGARGGDEINLVRAGKNYGWPIITYGIEYSGGKIGDGITQKEGLEQPLYYWDPSIAPSGMAFYSADLFPEWKGSLFVGALAGRHLARLTLEGDRVVGEERLLVDRGRVRDVRVGPEGAVYVLMDQERPGELLVLTRK
jgi:glucose/arabinose dehydrogenase